MSGVIFCQQNTEIQMNIQQSKCENKINKNRVVSCRSSKRAKWACIHFSLMENYIHCKLPIYEVYIWLLLVGNCSTFIRQTTPINYLYFNSTTKKKPLKYFNSNWMSKYLAKKLMLLVKMARRNRRRMCNSKQNNI